MKMQFFTIPIRDPQRATDELNAFLASHRVVHTERQFVVDGQNSVWSICVSYVEGEGRPAPEKRRKVDYREILPDDEFAVFVKLRALRKELADREGVPAYALFTNEQLADMIRRRASSLEGLKGIDGIGLARIEKYGEAFLGILKGHVETLKRATSKAQEHETNSDLP